MLYIVTRILFHINYRGYNPMDYNIWLVIINDKKTLPAQKLVIAKILNETPISIDEYRLIEPLIKEREK